MNKKEVCKIIGKNIQYERKKQGYTQETFAELMGVTWSYVSKVEAGILNLSVCKIFEISQHLNIHINKLLKFEDKSL